MLKESTNRRRDPRIEVFAQAELKGQEVRIMEVRNVSSGGVYLVGRTEEYPDLLPGVDLELVIFGTEEGMGDDPEFNIVCQARIIRVDVGNPGKRPPGFGATIDPVDEDNRERLTKLLLRADHVRVGIPEGSIWVPAGCQAPFGDSGTCTSTSPLRLLRTRPGTTATVSAGKWRLWQTGAN